MNNHNLSSTGRALVWWSQTFNLNKQSAVTCTHTASESWLSDCFLPNWLIPPWMPNWCTLLKAALSVPSFRLPGARTSTDLRSLTPTPDRTDVTLFEGLQERSRAERQKAAIKYSTFKLYIHQQEECAFEAHRYHVNLLVYVCRSS